VSLTRCCKQKKEGDWEGEGVGDGVGGGGEGEGEGAGEGGEGEGAGGGAGEGGEGEGVKEEGEEKSERWQRRRRKRPWRVGGDGLWGVPTYPGAWTANLQLPCGSGLMRKIYFRRFLDDFFGEGTVLVSIFRKVAF